MARPFHPITNTLARTGVFGVVVGPFALLGLATLYNWSPYVTLRHVTRDQPVPFSHQHHVGGLGLDCRYCHTSVETSSFANVPPVKTCMTCHSQVWNDAPMLEPVRDSFASGVSLKWTRVYDLPDFVYFNHSIHVNKGVGCESCHGRVDHMPLMQRNTALYMSWCLSCHRNPEPNLRPRQAVLTMGYHIPANQRELGKRLAQEYNVKRLTDCYTCHR